MTIIESILEAFDKEFFLNYMGIEGDLRRDMLANIRTAFTKYNSELAAKINSIRKGPFAIDIYGTELYEIDKGDMKFNTAIDQVLDLIKEEV